MKNSMHSFLFVVAVPVLLVLAFQNTVVKADTNRSPSVEKQKVTLTNQIVKYMENNAVQK